MLKKYADRWVKALRSGKYKQGKSYLRKGDEFCCLGVLCDLLEVKNTSITCSRIYIYEYNSSYLPESVVEKCKIYSNLGRSRSDSFTNLNIMNDRGDSFSKIASHIEDNYKDL